MIKPPAGRLTNINEQVQAHWKYKLTATQAKNYNLVATQASHKKNYKLAAT